MKISDQLQPLTNFFYGSQSIRPLFNEEEAAAIPTICSVERKLFKDRKVENQYLSKLFEIISKREVDGRIDVLANNTVSAHWVDLHLNENLTSFNKFPEEINTILKKINNFASQHQVDVSEYIIKIQQIIEEYKADPNIKREIELLEQKKIVIREWHSATENSTQKLKEDYYKNNPDVKNSYYIKYDNNLDTNQNLISLKDLVDNKVDLFKDNASGKSPYYFNYSLILEYIEKINNETINSFLKIRSNGINMTLADNFLNTQVRNRSNNAVINFLQTKTDDHKLIEIEGKNIKSIMLFKDNSILLKKNDDTYEDIFTRKQLLDIKNILVIDFIREKFKKNPTVAKNFIDIMKMDDNILTLDILNTTMETYSKNIEFFNNKPFDIRTEFKDAFSKKNNNLYRAIEDIDDRMNKKIKEHKVLLFAHSISSNKYKNLYNAESYKIIENIYDLKLKTNVFQDYIGKKIAAYKTPEEFNEGLNKFLASFNSFEMPAMINKVEDAGARVISDTDNILVVAIDSYEQSKLLGSSSWCIVRNESYFNSYTGNGNQQYFVFDFSKDSADEASMMGITLDKRGDYSAAHFKDDSEMEEDDDMICYVQEIVDNLNYKEKVNSKIKLSVSE